MKDLFTVMEFTIVSISSLFLGYTDFISFKLPFNTVLPLLTRNFYRKGR